MITYIDTNNKEKYTVLFEKASAKLGLMPIDKEITSENGETVHEYWVRYQDPEDGAWKERKLDETNDADRAFIEGKTSKVISSLNEYFQHITDLAGLAIGEGRHGSDPYFLRLPLDEPFLEINANTRAITVPNDLRQIGVRGDKYAEVVFFKIDRYFDAVDLATRQIYIEWEDANGNKGVSRDFLKDTQSEKDKIIFGWIIGDELTEHVGTIRFAVRFVEWTNKEDSAIAPGEGRGLEYSFSSLPAQMTIVDSLNYSLFENDEEASMIDTAGQGGTIHFYLEDSDPDSADETEPEKASIPEFVRNLRNTLGAVAKDGIYEADLIGADLELMVEAYPNGDSGNISYIFARKDKLDSGSNGITAKIKMIPVELTSAEDAVEGARYYQKMTNDTFEPVSIENLDFVTEESVTVYEKVAYVVVDQPGYYFAKAKNSVGGKKSSTADSDILYVPYADAPIISKAIPERFVISERTFAEAKDDSVDQTTIVDMRKSNIKIVMSEEAGPASIILGAAAVGPVFSAEKTKGFTYTWYKDGAVIADATESTLIVTEPGIYSVSVVNSYNNDTEEITKEEVGSIRVTRMPEIPVVEWDKWTSVLAAGRTEEFIEVNEKEHDKISYEWHKITPDNSDMDPVADGDMALAAGEIEFQNGVGRIPFKPIHEGDYYFIIKNELNGASILMNSALDPNMGVIAVRTSGSSNPTPESDVEPTNPTDEPSGE